MRLLYSRRERSAVSPLSFFCCFLIVCAAIIMIMMILSVLSGMRVMAVVTVLFASPIPLLYLATRFERRQLNELLDLAHLPWSLVSDAFLLTAVAALAAASVKRMSCEQWNATASVRWLVYSMIIGVAAGFLFHYVDGLNYIEQGAGAMLNSPTKLAHDFLTIPVLLSSFVYFAPGVFRVKTWRRWAILACLLGWLALVVIDTQRGLDLSYLHVEWDTARFAPL